jgi:hypothetical protein
MPDSFLLSKPFVEKLRTTVARVNGTPVPGASGSSISPRLDDPGQQPLSFRIGTFDGAWNQGAYKDVTLTSSATSATVNALNLFADVNNAGDSGVNCAIARDGAVWYLIASEC